MLFFSPKARFEWHSMEIYYHLTLLLLFDFNPSGNKVDYILMHKATCTYICNLLYLHYYCFFFVFFFIKGFADRKTLVSSNLLTILIPMKR